MESIFKKSLIILSRNNRIKREEGLGGTRMVSVKRGKRISYAEFIERTLYDTSTGYYTKGVSIGKDGDFFTTPTMSNVFAEIIFYYFLKTIRKNNLPPYFCEIGSGTGAFSRAFLKASAKEPSLRNKLRYFSVERSPAFRAMQRDLETNPSFQLFSHIDEVPKFSGMIFSNEFFDALPVHVVTKKRGKLFEVMLEREGDVYFEVEVPLSNQKIFDYFKTYPELVITDNQRIEIPLEMVVQYKKLAHLLIKGFIVTIDYGYTFEELKRPSLQNGSLRGFKRHRLVTEPFNSRGDIDITYHIHFDALIQLGKSCGYLHREFLRQDEFLIKNGILNGLQSYYGKDPFHPIQKKNRAIRTLIDPNGISSFFHVLVQEK